MNNKRLENFTESTIYLILVKALSFLPLLMLPLLARSEESFVFSQVMLVITIERFLFIVYEFGSHLPNINTISNILKNNGMNRSLNEISLIFSKVKFLRLLIWCFVALLIFLSLNFFEFASINRNFLWICLLSGLFRVLSPIWLFQAIRQLRYQFIMAIFSKMICFLVITYLFYLDLLTGFNFLLVFALSDLLGLIIGFIYFYNNKFRIISFSLRSFKNTAQESLNYCIGRISSALYNYLAPILLGILNPTNFVLYSLSERIFSALQSINSPLMDSLFTHRISDSIGKFRLAIILVFFFSSFISIIIYIFANQIVIILFGEEYKEASSILRLLCITFVIQSLSSILGHPFLTNKGYGSITNNSVTFGLFFCLIFLSMILLNQTLTSITVAFLLLFTELIVLIFRVIFIILRRKEILFKY